VSGARQPWRLAAAALALGVLLGLAGLEAGDSRPRDRAGAAASEHVRSGRHLALEEPTY